MQAEKKITQEPGRKRQGFASMTKEQRSRIAQMGGRIAHQLGRAHRWTQEEARIAGRKGGQISRRRKREVLPDGD